MKEIILRAVELQNNLSSNNMSEMTLVSIVEGITTMSLYGIDKSLRNSEETILKYIEVASMFNLSVKDPSIMKEVALVYAEESLSLGKNAVDIFKILSILGNLYAEAYAAIETMKLEEKIEAYIQYNYETILSREETVVNDILGNSILDGLYMSKNCTIILNSC